MGYRMSKATTKGWQICVKCKDVSYNCIGIKDLKECYLVKLAKYSINHNSNEKPAFYLWVPCVRKKRYVILTKVKSKYWHRTYTYVIKIPKSANEAYRIDIENKNN